MTPIKASSRARRYAWPQRFPAELHTLECRCGWATARRLLNPTLVRIYSRRMAAYGGMGEEELDVMDVHQAVQEVVAGVLGENVFSLRKVRLLERRSRLVGCLDRSPLMSGTASQEHQVGLRLRVTWLWVKVKMGSVTHGQEIDDCQPCAPSFVPSLGAGGRLDGEHLRRRPQETLRTEEALQVRRDVHNHAEVRCWDPLLEGIRHGC